MDSSNPDVDCKKAKISNDPEDRETKRLDIIAAIENLDIEHAYKLMLEYGTEGVSSIYLSLLMKDAIEADNRRIVKYLLTKNPELRTESGKSPLWEAVSIGAMNVAVMLVRNGADLTERYNYSNFLHVLVSSKDYWKHELAMLMLEHGADPMVTDAFGNTVLHCALRTNSPSLIRKLLEKGAKIDVENKYGENVLALAASKPEARLLIDMLLENSATDMTVRNALLKNTIMSCMCRQNVNFNAIRILCQSGFDINTVERGETLIYHAIIAEANEEAIELLLQLGADMTSINYKYSPRWYFYSRLQILIKRSIAGVSKCKIFQTERKKFERIPYMKVFYKKCRRQAKQMEAIMLSDNLSVSKILKLSKKMLSWTIRNSNLIAIYEKNRKRISFLCSIYYKDIEAAFEKAKEIKLVLDLKEEAFTEALNNFLSKRLLEKIFFFMYMTYD